MNDPRPMLHLVAGKELWDLVGPGRAKIVGMGAELDHKNLPFAVDQQGEQLPPGKVMFALLTTGEYWIIAGGFELPQVHFAGLPISRA
jgi:hypothetical protein